jgi:hypothetical protein
VSSPRLWQPAGFANVFEIPSGIPATPLEVAKLPAVAFTVEFHRQRFLSLLHRNGVTREQLAEGYMVQLGGHLFTDEEILFYGALGIPV